MTVDPVKSSIDRRLVRAGKLPIAIKTEKHIKKIHEIKEKDAVRNNFYKKTGNNTLKERKKER